jgi:hypothetical protein
MRMTTVAQASVCVLIVAATSILAAPEPAQQQPGQLTQARVWVQNRGRAETIPVDLREINLDAPMKVQVINGDPGFARTNPVQVTEIRKAWEYETITLQSPDDVLKVLNPKGVTGWETTGIAFVNPGGTTLLLKRPR